MSPWERSAKCSATSSASIAIRLTSDERAAEYPPAPPHPVVKSAMGTPGVGEDIESICGRCGGETWHAVMAKVGEKIVNVVCKRCGTHHMYRGAPGSAAVDDAAKRTAGAERRNSGTGTRHRRRTTPMPPPAPITFDPSK